MKYSRASVLLYLKRSSLPLILFCCCAVSFTESCSTARINPLFSQEPDVTINSREFSAKQIELEQLWEKRHLPDSLDSFIELSEQISRTRNREFKGLVRLARAYHLRGEYFQKARNAKLADWEMGMNWAEKALTLNPEYRSRVINQRLAPEHAMDSVKPTEIEALYWYAANLGKWASLNGMDSILKYKSRIKKIIDAIAERAPDLYYGAVYRYYGAYYALLPGYNRNDLEYSRKSFETAVTKFPQYFTNRTLYAQIYAVKMKDTALFERQLRWVVQANPKLVREFYSEQLLEQKRAAELLKEKR